MALGSLPIALLLALGVAAATASRATSTTAHGGSPPFREMVGGAIETAGAGNGYRQLRELFRDQLDSKGARRVPAFTRELLVDPLSLEESLKYLAMGEIVDPAALVDAQLRRFQRQFGFDEPACNLRNLGPHRAAAEDPPQKLEAMFSAAAALVSGAFRSTSEAERVDFLGFLEQMLDDTAGCGDDCDENAKAFAETLARVVGKVDFAALDCAMRELAGMTDPALLGELRTWLERARPITRPSWLDPRITGDLLWAASTAHGVFLIGAGGSNIYGAPAAAIIDLDGDDVYLGHGGYDLQRVAGATGLVIDLAGDDLYLENGDGSAGGAVMGAALLYDAGGDDTYVSRRIAQGAGVVGHGVLIDAAGDDFYAVDSIGQGAAFVGTGLAWDGAGRDRWSAALLAQGSGGPLGLGVLVDSAGDDVFRAGDRYPSSYGTPGIFQALAQGAGWGIRPGLAGGVGLMEDSGGDDIYFAGNFSQGAGYFLGTGMLWDHQGNDRYRGTRYSQGAAAHLAAGILVDEGGNDSYRGQVAANQGAGWDLAVGILLDTEGDDEYAGADLSQGSAAQNGIGFFVDYEGKDRYRSSGDAAGFSGPLTYDNGRQAGNLAVFIKPAEGDAHDVRGAGRFRLKVNGGDATYPDR